MFLRYSDEGLAQSSFLLACDRTRQAVVIDPRRDIGVYVAAARQQGLTLTTAIETHVHADFVSGARELQDIGAQVVAGPGARLRYPNHEAADGEHIAIRIEGFIGGGFDARRGAGLPTSTTPQVSVTELRAALARSDRVSIVDVRTAKEWRAGHLDGAINIPAGDVASRLLDLPRDGQLTVLCEGGYRSSLATSLLEREGLAPANVTGGMAAYRALEAV